MRGLKTLLSSIAISAMTAGFVMAAPPPKAPTALARVEADCQRVGGEISALIDTKTTSPNIAAARAAFQIGIMECMEGDSATANQHYQDAKFLLTGERSRTPAAPAVPAKAVAVEADCQNVGSDVSALIDTKLASPNISAARAAFQVGIMECMEGDNTTANRHYQEAKGLLGQ